MELNKIYNEDCLITLSKMGDNSIDLTVTSPPYDNLRTYNNHVDETWNQDVWKKIIKELFRVTKESGVVVWVVGDATTKGSETGSSFRQALWAMECGFRLHDTMIWKKNAIPYDPKCERYWQSFDYMFIWSKGKPKCNYIKVPCKHAGKKKTNDYGQRRQDGTLRTDRHRDDRVIKETKVKDNVWYFPNSKQKGNHPARFPEQLANDHILSWSNEGDVVYDPFMGSGTTAIMALKNGRNYIGSEISEEYTKLGESKVNNHEFF
jgi:site-specific DNA-methyltransferase (adenine-specific)